jgi:pseudouridine synthase
VYHVKLDRPPSAIHVQQWAAGVKIATPSSTGKELRTHRTLPCQVRRLSAEEVKQLNLSGDASSGQAEADAADSRSSNRSNWVEFALREGRNRQIRRMAHALNYTVKELHRAQFCGVGLEGLQSPGQWAPLTEAELQRLRGRK